MTGKLDRRKKYTRNVLKESLIRLLAEKPISSITVKEICEIADINRSTFYTHYADHYDLLDKIEEEVTADLNEYLNKFSASIEEESVQLTEILLTYIIENKVLFKTLLNQNASPTFEKRLMNLTRQFMMNNWMTAPMFKQGDSKYLSTFVISGAIHVIKDWIENEMDQSPEDMAVMINNFINYGFSYLG